MSEEEELQALGAYRGPTLVQSTPIPPKDAPNMSRRPYLPPMDWRRQNPTADWNEWIQRYGGPDYDQDRRSTPYMPFEKFKKLAPQGTQKDWEEFNKRMKESEDFVCREEAFQQWLKNNPGKTEQDFDRAFPNPFPQGEDEMDEMERLMTPEDFQKWKHFHSQPDDSRGNPGRQMEQWWLQDRATDEWLKRHPDKLVPRLPQTPIPKRPATPRGVEWDV